MITSNEISQIFMAQNQQFMQQNTFAHSIGISPPAAGLGGYGSIGAPPPMYQGGPSPFSYAPVGFGAPSMGPGNRFASTGMSLVGAGATLGMGALGVASMFKPFTAITPFVDPIGGAINGFRAGGLMGGLAGAALPLGITAVAGYGANQLMRGGMQQGAVNTGLNQFQFQNPNSRTGMGFSRQDAGAIGEQIRSLAVLPEMMSSMEELTRMLPRLKASGVMQGVKDATEFSRRFKESINTIRDMSKILGTTMEDAEQFFTHSRSVGFLGKQDQLRNTFNAQLTSGLTGLSMGQVMGLQQNGASIAGAIGGNRRFGAIAAFNIAQNVGLAQQNGLISAGAVENATGLLGSEAIGSFASKMTQVAIGMGQSSAGRLLIAGMLNKEGTGLDDDLVKRFNSGGLSAGELRSRGMNLSQTQKLNFTARAEDIASELAAKSGPGGMATLLGNLTHGNDPKTAILLRRMGNMSFDEASLAMNMRGVGAGAEGNQMQDIKMREAQIRDLTDPDAIARRIKTRLANIIQNPLQGAGSRMFNSLARSYEGFVDDLVGRHVISLTNEGAKSFERAMVSGNNRGMKDLFAAAAGHPVSQSSSFASQLGDSEMMASIRGYRTPVGQAKELRRFLGGNSPEAITSAINDGSFFTQDMNAAAGIVTRLKAGITGFEGMSSDRQRDAITGAVKRKIFSSVDSLGLSPNVRAIIESNGSTGDLRRLAPRLFDNLSKVGAEGKDAAMLLRAGLSGADNMPILSNAILGADGKNSPGDLQIGVSPIDPRALLQYTSIAGRSGALSKAEDSLRRANLNESTIALIKKGGGARRALSDAQTSKDLVGIILGGTDDVVWKNLKDRGYNLDPGDIGALKAALKDTMRDGVDTQKLTMALDEYGMLSKASDYTSIANTFAQTASSLANGIVGAKGVSSENIEQLRQVQSAISAVGSASPTDMGNALKNARGSVSSLISKIAGMSPGSKQRRAILNAAGGLGDVIQRVLVEGRRLGGTMSIGSIADRFHVSSEAIGDAFGMSGTIDPHTMVKLTSRKIADIEAGVVAARGLGVSSGRVDIAGAGAGDSLSNTLKSLNDNLKIQGSVNVAILEAFNSYSHTKEGDAALQRAKEVQANLDGTSTTGGK